VREADIEYKFPGESRFRSTTRPIHKLVLVVPLEEQTMEETGKLDEQELGVDEPEDNGVLTSDPELERG
jgi:hypothetical protein